MPLSDNLQTCANCGVLIMPQDDSHVRDGKFTCTIAMSEADKKALETDYPRTKTHRNEAQMYRHLLR